MTPLQNVINQLTNKGLHPKKAGSGYQAHCPAHEDNKASLRIDPGDKGVLLKCHAGCETPRVVEALDLKMSDLFAQPPSGHQQPSGDQANSTFTYDDENGAVLFRVQRMPGKKFVQSRPVDGEWVYQLGTVKRVPYRLRRVIAAIQNSEVIYVVEGEKDVHTLEALGLTATCNAGGAGKWRPEYADWFKRAKVVCIPDNDEPGKKHAEAVAHSLSQWCRWVKVLTLPVEAKQDVSDWINGGGTLDQLLELVDECPNFAGVQPTVITAPKLMEKVFPEAIMAVPGIVAEGITFLVGAPKIGKSWMSLGLGLSVASGDKALGTIDVTQGPVLYLALEDTERRLQRRLDMILSGRPAPKDFEFATEWPRFGSGGLEHIDNWILDHPNARLVMIDTWAKIRSATGDESMYSSDYAAVSMIKQVADRHGVGIVLVHHQRKAADSDPLNTVSGSTGLTGAADATAVLTRARNDTEGTLYVTGRDLEESRSMVSFDGATGSWLWLGEAEQVEENRKEDSIIKMLASCEEAVGPKQMAEMLDEKEGTMKWLMAKLAEEGKIGKIGRGKYVPVDAVANQPTSGAKDSDDIANQLEIPDTVPDEWGELDGE